MLYSNFLKSLKQLFFDWNQQRIVDDTGQVYSLKDGVARGHLLDIIQAEHITELPGGVVRLSTFAQDPKAEESIYYICGFPPEKILSDRIENIINECDFVVTALIFLNLVLFFCILLCFALPALLKMVPPDSGFAKKNRLQHFCKHLQKYEDCITILSCLLLGGGLFLLSSKVFELVGIGTNSLSLLGFFCDRKVRRNDLYASVRKKVAVCFF